MTKSRCNVCEGVLGPARFPGLLRCRSCSFVTADLSLSDAQLRDLYTERYFVGQEYSDYRADRQVIQKNFRARMKVLSPYIEKAEEKRLFEIGCAYGFFLDIAKSQFFHAQGIDISEAANWASSQLGLDVVQGDFLDYPVKDPIDVACLWDTIEHLKSPELYIAKLSRHMPSSGILAITTGDIGSFVARFRGKRWRQIHPPTHLHYFSRGTLAALLDRYKFDVRYCSYDGAFRSLDMIAAVLLTVRNNRPGIYRALKRTGLLRLDVYLNLRDILYVIAERR